MALVVEYLSERYEALSSSSRTKKWNDPDQSGVVVDPALSVRTIYSFKLNTEGLAKHRYSAPILWSHQCKIINSPSKICVVF
jgi:hypothetical protein